MREGTRKLFPTNYEGFVHAMATNAETGNLPVGLSLDDTEGYSIQDFEDLFRDFNEDTGLEIMGTLYVCPECGKLHLHVSIDYAE